MNSEDTAGAAGGIKQGQRPKCTIMKKLLRFAGGLMICLVLFIAGLNLFEYRRCLRFEPTGDELFDTYARLVIRRQALRLFYTGMNEGRPNPAALPDSELQKLETRFGGDPRYWELRCWNANSQRYGVMSSQGPFTMGYGIEFLQSAREAGAADSNLLLLQYLMRRGMQTSLRAEDSPPTPEEQHELLELLDAAVAVTDEDAFPLIRRALFHLETSELGEASADLRTANGLKRCSQLAVFPQSFVRDRQATGLVSGNELLSFNIRMGWQGEFYDPWWELKEGLPPARRCFLTGQHMLLIDDLHTALCRLGMSHTSEEWGAARMLNGVNYISRSSLLVPRELNRQQRLLALWTTRFCDGLREDYLDTDNNDFYSMYNKDRAPLWLALLFPPMWLNEDSRAYFRHELGGSRDISPEDFHFLLSIDYSAEDYGLVNFESDSYPRFGNPGPASKEMLELLEELNAGEA